MPTLCHNSYCSQYNFVMIFRSSSDFSISLRYYSILNALVQSVKVSAHLCILKRELSTLTDDCYLIFDCLTVLRTGLVRLSSNKYNKFVKQWDSIHWFYSSHVSNIARGEWFSLSFIRNWDLLIFFPDV